MGHVVETLHEQYAKGRRARVLARHFADLIPSGKQVLDVGTGDGSIAADVLARRPDVRLSGLEYQVREDCAIPVEAFDGRTLPFGDGACDYVSFLDVLHHTPDPMVLLREGVRVARRGLIIKDHLRQGPLAASTLRFMDRVGNRRFGIDLPHTYWTPDRWQSAFRELGLTAAAWHGDLGLYPAWADWVFGRGLHFFARLEKAPEPGSSDALEYWHEGLSCCNERWEAAYNRFETPEQERRKFAARFRELGIDRLPRETGIVDLFCGRGAGLQVLAGWGFRNLAGVDLSPGLLKECPVGIRRIVADCRYLRFPEDSIDVFIVQGGLHHLPGIPEDLRACLREVRRCLRPGGCFFVVEPWDTPFLRLVHALTRLSPVRACLPRMDAFATMVEEEQETYRQWLASGSGIRAAFEEAFSLEEFRTGWGKCRIIARKPERNASHG